MSGVLQVHRAFSLEDDPNEAAAALAKQLPERADCTLVFTSSDFELPTLARALADQLPGPLIGCTSAGPIGPAGFQPRGIVAASLTGALVRTHSLLIEPLDDFHRAFADFPAWLERVQRAQEHGERSFGFLLVDGLSRREEHLMAALYTKIGEIPIVGGSAGDDLKFEQTHVYHKGSFHKNAALLSIFQTKLPFELFKFEHHKPTEKRFVVTAVDPEERRVKKINGRPAAEVYAEMLGIPRAALKPELFAANPFILQLGEQSFLRGIQQIYDDDSVQFYCAVERGLVLRLGRSDAPVETLRAQLSGLTQRLGESVLTVCCDCIQRRLEYESLGTDKEIGQIHANFGSIGFSTYGEQWGGLHVNQSLVGFALGRAA